MVMAKYLVIFKMQITDHTGTAEQTFEETINCNPDELREKITCRRERAERILASKCDEDDLSSISVVHVISL